MGDLIRIPLEILRDNTGIDRFTYLIRGVLWAVAKRLKVTFVTRLWNGARIKVFPSSSFSGIFYFRYPEGTDMKFLRANCFAEDTFVDVGANVGIVSALMADRTRTLVLFEPNEESFHSLECMAALNRQFATFELHKIAISDERGTVHFLNEEPMSGINRVVSAQDPRGRNVSVVQADTLDNVLGDRFDRIVMKIDIEGGEEKAFLGATRLLNARRVRLLMFERLGRTNLENILKLLSAHSYRVFRVKSDGALSTSHGDISVPLINLFACPDEHFDGLLAIRA